MRGHSNGYSRHLHYRHSTTPQEEAGCDLSRRIGGLQCLQSVSALQVFGTTLQPAPVVQVCSTTYARHLPYRCTLACTVGVCSTGEL